MADEPGGEADHPSWPLGQRMGGHAAHTPQAAAVGTKRTQRNIMSTGSRLAADFDAMSNGRAAIFRDDLG
jgi:hypothetical protein